MKGIPISADNELYELEKHAIQIDINNNTDENTGKNTDNNTSQNAEEYASQQKYS